LRAEAVVVTLQGFPCCPIAVGHGLELHETLVFLFLTRTLPLVGRVSDIEGIVISDSSWLHVLIHFKLID
jgi:hypothetical protein